MRWQSFIKTTHVWIGLIFGALLCVTCLSGSISVFRPQLEAMFTPKIALSDAHANLDSAVARVLSAIPDARLTRIYLPTPAQHAYVLLLESGKKNQRRIVVDAGTGAIAGEMSVPGLDWMLDLHHNMLAGHTGRNIVGIVGIILFVTSLSGLVLSLLRKPSWKSFTTIRASGPKRRFYYELHRATGLWAYCFLTLLSFTGIALAYPDAFRAILGHRAATAKVKLSGTESFRPFEEYVAISRAALPAAQLTEIRLPKSSKDPISVRFRMSADLGELGRNELSLDAAGRILNTRFIAGEPTGARIQTSFTPIHYGEVGGLAIRILWSLAGAAPAVLFVTGLLFWFGKKPRRDEQKQPREESPDEILMTQQSL